MNWTELKNQSDIDKLLHTFGGFHDSCLKELHMWTGTYVEQNFGMCFPRDLGSDTNARVLFQRQWPNPAAIELLFEGVTKIQIVPPPAEYLPLIFDAQIVLHNDQFHWTDNDEWKTGQAYSESINLIASKGLKWRDVSEWLGKQNRYGVINEENC
ncbi:MULTISPECIES: hypothetical protein [Bacillaceae]|uniref:YubB ferredoxin-like domain-containing protein n=1 Tax=Evansella alkalicola TaxID=745819 RepID=A0ABS6JXF5_9BACI|nr:MULTISPECIES: hypothetical protein [Bacillaceae]MBU9722776.1 hypothetical protein [Bacillus alkalicola]